MEKKECCRPFCGMCVNQEEAKENPQKCRECEELPNVYIKLDFKKWDKINQL